METLDYYIDKQFEYNRGKNLFHKEIYNSLRFCPEMDEAVRKVQEIDQPSADLIIQCLTDRTLKELCDINQYYSFNELSRINLRKIYSELFSEIKKHGESCETISGNHYKKLIDWLRRTDPFAEKIYSKKDLIISSVPCYEYSPDIQMEILNINILTIKNPVLDIGCGKNGILVSWLRHKGIDAFGIDRFAPDTLPLSSSDWFEYQYGINKWGTIISNLGFSNHFIHHHLRNNGSYEIYAKQYMRILNSLKTGGSIHYAPDLQFIEYYLDPKYFIVIKHPFRENNFSSTTITRIG
jgi:hypothetical protein